MLLHNPFEPLVFVKANAIDHPAVFFVFFLSRIGLLVLQSVASPAATCVKRWSRSVPWVLLKQLYA